jgi:hypothetical protein
MPTEYYLLEEPKPGTQQAQAFDAIDQAFGTDPFTKEQAVAAIANQCSCATPQAEALFNSLESNEHIG